MRVANVRLLGFLTLALFVSGLSMGCDKEGKWYGTYKNSKDGSTLVLQNEHKGSYDMGGTKADLTWEATADDKITVHMAIPIQLFRLSDGNLRDEEGTVWKKA